MSTAVLDLSELHDRVVALEAEEAALPARMRAAEVAGDEAEVLSALARSRILPHALHTARLAEIDAHFDKAVAVLAAATHPLHRLGAMDRKFEIMAARDRILKGAP